MDSNSFLRQIEKTKPTTGERAVALLWFFSCKDDSSEFSIKELTKIIEDSGFGKQNAHRLNSYFTKDKRVVKGSSNKFKIKYKAMDELNNKYNEYFKNKPIKVTDSVIEFDLFKKSRGYIKKVVMQINSSYDHSLFDCCAVMCRRLVETLIIEVYEEYKSESDIKDNNGHYYMLSGLLNSINNQQHFNLGRNTKKFLSDFKNIGDLSAHNRRFNARKSDIDNIKLGLRVASEELLSFAKQI
ncbi:MAG: DUF4145 domain-containing protein [bacterium]